MKAAKSPSTDASLVSWKQARWQWVALINSWTVMQRAGVFRPRTFQHKTLMFGATMEVQCISYKLEQRRYNPK